MTKGYIEGVLESSPLLSALVVSKTADSIELSNNISIEVRAASFKRTRGMTTIAVTITEPAFLPTDDSANPDTELLTALRPSLATTSGPLVLITTPYRRHGEFGICTRPISNRTATRSFSWRKRTRGISIPCCGRV